MFGAIESLGEDVNECSQLVTRAAELAGRWPKLAPADKRAHLIALIDRIDLQRETLEIHLLPGRLLSILRDGNDRQDWTRSREDSESIITFTVPARLKRTGIEIRLLIDGAGGGARKKPDHSLYRLLAQAQRYNEMVMRNGGKRMGELAAEAGVGSSYFTRILRLSFLAPDIVKAILHDRHPIELTAKRLANEFRLPITWEEQRKKLAIS